MKISPTQIVAISVIRREGNLSRAAEALNSSQPALSRLVTELEQRLGSPLFDRSSRPWKMTHIGDALAQQGANIEASQARAERFVDELKLGSRGSLRIGGPPFFMDTLVAPMIARFQGRHPGIQIDQSYGYPTELTRKVQNGEVDLAICPLDPFEDTGSLSFVNVLPARNVVAARWDHPLFTRKRPVDSADLAEYSWIAPPENSPLRYDLQSSLLAAGLQNIRIAYSGAGLTGLVNYLKNSDCLTILPHSVVFEMRHQQEISALPFKLTAPVRSLGLLIKAAAAQVASVSLLHEHVEAEFDVVRDLIRRHENLVLWGNSSKSL